MKGTKSKHSDTQQEINLKSFFVKIYKHRLYFLLSICAFVVAALIYLQLATPKYAVSTSILIDSSGSNRVLGDNRYVDGGVNLIEMEKNLYNEIGVLKSFSLINQTVEDLGFDISYYGGNWYKKKEYYRYFPFEVILNKTESQVFGVPFEIEILSKKKYRLSIDTSKFKFSNPSNGSTHEVNKDLNFSGEFSFGERVRHVHFDFVLKKPDDYNINFNDLDLSFIIHDLNSVTNNYLANVDAENIDIQASIFKIVSYGAVVDKEIDFLQKLTENYVQNKLDSRNKIATGKESFIRNQLRIISDSLSKMESNLEFYKRDNRALNLGATATNALGKTSNLQVEKAKIELDIKYYNSLIQNVQANRISEDFVIPTAIGIEDPLINENILEIKKLYAERSKKKFFVTDTNQEMKMLNQQINESTSLLLNNLSNAVKSSRFALERVVSQLSSYNGVISSLPERENQLLTIQRQSTLYENLFNYLSQELAKTGIARAENTSDTRILDAARMVGDKPVAPQKMLLLTLAVILGTLLPLAWMVLFSSDDIIHDLRQIVAHTDIPVIASIANHDTKAKNDDAHISLWKVKESFRDLSANLKSISPKNGCTVVGVASIMPEEGKTFCAINLGISLAEGGNKTLIIDTDLRSPSLIKEINKIDEKGLSNYLQGDISTLNDIIHPHEKLSSLDFIPTHVANSNTHKLLSGIKMNSMILELKKEYDYIILDTPPTGLVSDYILFSDFIDVNLFIVRSKITKVTFLKDFEKLMLRGKKQKSYIIFNDVIAKDHKYGYGEMYGANRESQLIKDSMSV